MESEFPLERRRLLVRSFLFLAMYVFSSPSSMHEDRSARLFFFLSFYNVFNFLSFIFDVYISLIDTQVSTREDCSEDRKVDRPDERNNPRTI